MITSHFHLYPQFIYELFHILYRRKAVELIGGHFAPHADSYTRTLQVQESLCAIHDPLEKVLHVSVAGCFSCISTVSECKKLPNFVWTSLERAK